VEVRLYRKPKIWRLDPECAADALNLRRHTALPLESKQVLDYGVTKHNVEASVGELADIRCVADQRLDIIVSLFFL
jgi:hypothetical protein